MFGSNKPQYHKGTRGFVGLKDMSDNTKECGCRAESIEDHAVKQQTICPKVSGHTGTFRENSPKSLTLFNGLLSGI